MLLNQQIQDLVFMFYYIVNIVNMVVVDGLALTSLSKKKFINIYMLAELILVIH